jgi:hypothetical protein
MNHSLQVIRTLSGYRYRPLVMHSWRQPLPGDTPLELVERTQRVAWRTRNAVPGYSHRISRASIMALRPVRRLLREERARVFAAADRFAEELGIGHE